MYTGKTFIRQQTYLCGDFAYVDIYPVWQQRGKRRGKCKPTRDIQKRLNQKRAERWFTMLVHKNFTKDDIALHLTYRKGCEPENEEEAQRCLSNFLRRLRRKYKKLGLELKYVSCTEYGKRTGRAHHHLIITGGVDRDEVEAIWGMGYANSKRLQFEETGIVGLTRYMVKDKHFYKRWNQSKNLSKPEAETHDGRLTVQHVKEAEKQIEECRAHEWFETVWPEYTLVEAECERNNINRGAYIHAVMRRRR